MPAMITYGNELLRIVTSKGIYRSTDEGRNWSARYMSSSCGEFLSLTDNGGEVLANTTKGLYRSKDGGRNWSKK